MKETPLTLPQADDCARYFLGPTWSAGAVPGAGIHACFLINKSPHVRHVLAPTWEDALRIAGVELFAVQLFVQAGKTVRRKHTNEVIAHAISKTMAQRIANALNSYSPGARGY